VRDGRWRSVLHRSFPSSPPSLESLFGEEPHVLLFSLFFSLSPPSPPPFFRVRRFVGVDLVTTLAFCRNRRFFPFWPSFRQLSFNSPSVCLGERRSCGKRAWAYGLKPFSPAAPFLSILRWRPNLRGRLIIGCPHRNKDPPAVSIRLGLRRFKSLLSGRYSLKSELVCVFSFLQPVSGKVNTFPPLSVRRPFYGR